MFNNCRDSKADHPLMSFMPSECYSLRGNRIAMLSGLLTQYIIILLQGSPPVSANSTSAYMSPVDQLCPLNQLNQSLYFSYRLGPPQPTEATISESSSELDISTNEYLSDLDVSMNDLAPKYPFSKEHASPAIMPWEYPSSKNLCMTESAINPDAHILINRPKTEGQYLDLNTKLVILIQVLESRSIPSSCMWCRTTFSMCTSPTLQRPKSIRLYAHVFGLTPQSFILLYKVNAS
uniref:Uncharacterized protein n=1 Tax=Opuntia streptacantha TaxID=393608 RepID=A0A7C9ACT5_OPUST